MSVLSLLDTCQEYLGDHAQQYPVSCFAELPVTLLEGLLPYFAASELHRLHAMLVDAGVSVNVVWKKLKERRWSHGFQSFSTILNVDDDNCQNTDHHQKYMEKHFHDVLRYIQFGGALDPSERFHQRYRQTLDSTHYHSMGDVHPEAETLQKMLPDLLSHSHYIQRLSISHQQCAYIQQTELFAALRQTVRHLDVHHLTQGYYRQGLQVIQGLLQAGQLQALTLFHPQFLGRCVEELLYVCAGHSGAKSPTNSKKSRTEFINLEEIPGWGEDTGTDASAPDASTPDVSAPATVAAADAANDDDDDLYDEAVSSKTASHLGAFTGPSLTALGLVQPREDMVAGLNQAMVQLLPRWSSLRKLAFTRSDIPIDVQRAIIRKTRQPNSQLQYLILEGCSMTQSPLQTLTEMAALDKLKPPAMEKLSFSMYYVPMDVSDSTLHQLPELLDNSYLGTTHLDLSGCTFSSDFPNGFEAVKTWLMHDQALRHFTLHETDLQMPYGGQLFAALKGTHIESLDFCELSMQAEWLPQFLAMLQDSPRLRSLSLKSSIPAAQTDQFFASTEFSDAIVGHPMLEKLDLSDNHLGIHGTEFLLKVCLKCVSNQHPVQLKTLNLAATALEGKELLKVGQQIHRAWSQQRPRRPVLEHLVLHANPAGALQHKQLLSLYIPLVSQLDMERHGEFTMTMPMADYIAQM